MPGGIPAEVNKWWTGRHHAAEKIVKTINPAYMLAVHVKPSPSFTKTFIQLKGGYLMENKKKAIVVSIMGRLVKKTVSRHYWLYDGAKWVRLGLTRIADVLKISADVIKAAIYTATKKALASIATAEHDGSHSSVLWFETIGLTLFAVVYFLCYSLVGEDEGSFISVPISQGLALWVYHKVTTAFKGYKGGAAV